MTNSNIPASVPSELAALRAWLVWRYVPNGEKKPRKVPFYVSGAARAGTQNGPEDRAAMATFEEARDAAIAGGYEGVGFALYPGCNVVALDFDDCVKDGVIESHVADLVSGTYAEHSPSGRGIRAFMRGSLESRKDVDAKLGPMPVEYFGHNGFVTVTGNLTEECALFGFEDMIADLTPAVLRDYTSRFGGLHIPVVASSRALSASSDGDMGNLMLLTPTLGIGNAEIAGHLNELPADLDYDTWVKVGMAVHQETNGAGFDLWHNWSKGSPKYTTEGYCRDRWTSFGKFMGGAHITMAWVIKQANEQRARASYRACDEWNARIAACTDKFILREKLCPELAKDGRIAELDRDELANVLKKTLVGLGSNITLTQCRKLIAPEKRTQKHHADADLPEWARGWVWVTDDDQFYRLDSDERCSITSFNAMFNRLQPTTEDGTVKKNAAWVALEELNIEHVTRRVYLPWAGPIFDLDGVHCANAYRPSSVPTAVPALSASGQEAVRLVREHVSFLCGGRQEMVDTVLAWMAHNVQKPGTKIRWTPLVKGVEGDGKTLLGQVMSEVLGKPNVKQISPKVLGTDFSDWAHGACVGVLEEIKLTGHNRHDILNALKPFITNDQVAVHPKGRAEFNVCNTMNYMAFTNHSDALPLGETDRRWFIVFTPFGSKEALYAALGGLDAAGKYFDRLHGAIQAQPAELRRWLLDYPIPASFKPNGSAPDTAEKALMVGMSASPEEEAVREVLAEGAYGVTRDMLSSNCLSDALALRDDDVSLQTTSVNKVLTRLGFSKVPLKLKWRGRTHRIWTKSIANTEPGVLRAALEKTAESASGDAGDAGGSETAVDFFN